MNSWVNHIWRCMSNPSHALQGWLVHQTGSTRWGLLCQYPPWKHTFAIEYHVYIYDRCYRDSNNLRGTFARSKMLLTEKFTNGALVTPTPETPRLRGCNVAHMARVIYIYDIYMCVSVCVRVCMWWLWFTVAIIRWFQCQWGPEDFGSTSNMHPTIYFFKTNQRKTMHMPVCIFYGRYTQGKKTQSTS